MFANEWRAILFRPKVLIPIAAVLFIPLLYSGSFLWAFWDPYGHLDRLPVAVVNEDRGANLDGHSLHLGDDVVKRLKKTDSFSWHFVNRDKALNGLQNGDYYMAIVIPSDFSERATTVQDAAPEPLRLNYIVNEGANYLVGKIGDSAVSAIKEEIGKNVTKAYAEAMLTKMKEAGKGLKEAADGAERLHEGLQSAEQGSRQLAKGMGAAEQGSGQLAAGAQKLTEGAGKISGHLTELAQKSIMFDQGLQSASAGASQVKDGASALKSGLGQLAAGADRLTDGERQAQAGAARLAGGLNESLSGLQTLQSRLPALTDGAVRVRDGAEQLSQGMTQWKQKAGEAAAGAGQVSEGLRQYAAALQALSEQASDPSQKAMLQTLVQQLQPLVEGSKAVAAGVGKLAETAGPLQNGAARLADGADSLADGQQTVQEAVKKVTDGQRQLAVGAAELSDAHQRLAAGAAKLAQQLHRAERGAEALASGSGRLAQGVETLASGADRLVSGTHQLASGAEQLTAGAKGLAQGVGSLQHGMEQLSDGSRSLSTGLASLTKGAAEMEDRLKDGAKQAAHVQANDRVYDMIADPVQKKKQPLHHVPNYGTGFAPYFLSLGLFVGALLLTIVFPLREPVDRPTSGAAWFFGKWGILAVATAVQTLLADAWLLYGLDLHVQSVGRFLLFTWIISLTFMMIIQFLVTLFDNPGRFLAILLLIAQLIGSAGTYPIELVPDQLQALHPWLPMTHAIRGLRAVISSGDFAVMWEEATKLGMVAVIFAAGTLLYFHFLYRRRYRTAAEEPAMQG